MIFEVDSISKILISLIKKYSMSQGPLDEFTFAIDVELSVYLHDVGPYGI